MIEQSTQLIQGISPTFLAIGFFTLSIGLFVTGIKFMFWSFFELESMLKKYKKDRK